MEKRCADLSSSKDLVVKKLKLEIEKIEETIDKTREIKHEIICEK